MTGTAGEYTLGPNIVHFHPVHEPDAYMGEYMMFLSVKR
jgi:hypothetical protein